MYVARNLKHSPYIYGIFLHTLLKFQQNLINFVLKIEILKYLGCFLKMFSHYNMYK